MKNEGKVTLEMNREFVSLKAKDTIQEYHTLVNKVVSLGSWIKNSNTALHVYWNWTTK